MDSGTNEARERLDAISRMFRPSSIAIVGASRVSSSIGGRPIKYLKKYGFDGAVYPVNPNAAEIADLRCYASISEIDEEVDLAILAIPAKVVPAVLRQCADCNIRSVIIFSGGYAEIGESGRNRQAELKTLIRELGLCVMGPNSMGALSLHNGAMATFSAVLERSHKPGNLSLVSQSGAYGAYIMAQAEQLNIGFNTFASTGNECDLEFSEVLSQMISDSNTGAVLGYIEELRDGVAFLDAAKQSISADKPIVVMKVGKSETGAQAAASHTGAMAGTHASYEAAFKQAGVISVDTVDEMLDLAQLLQYQMRPTGDKVGILSISGGAGVLLADAVEECGLTVPTLSEELQQRLKDLVPFAAVSNPIDFTPQLLNDPAVYGRFLEIVVESQDVDVLFVFLAHTMGYEEAIGLKVVEETRAAVARCGKPIVVVGLPGDDGPVGRALREARLPYFADPSRAVKAFATLRRYVRHQSRHAERACTLNPKPIAESDVSSESSAKQFISRFGISVPKDIHANSASDSVRAARELGGQVVMKVNCLGIDHKSDYGGVKVGLSNPEEIENAYRDIVSSITRALPDLKMDGVIVQEMIPKGVEMMIGMKRDPVFGPMILCGLGGVFTEIFSDFSLMRAPVSHEEALLMIRSLRGFPILAGARGNAEADIGALADTIVKCSDIAVGADWISELDINPVIVGSKGQGCVAADVLIKACRNAKKDEQTVAPSAAQMDNALANRGRDS